MSILDEVTAFTFKRDSVDDASLLDAMARITGAHSYERPDIIDTRQVGDITMSLFLNSKSDGGIICVDGDDRVVGAMDLELFNNTPHDALTISLVMTDPSARKGLGYEMYIMALDNDLILRSGMSMSAGGLNVWKRLAADRRVLVWAELRSGEKSQVDPETLEPDRFDLMGPRGEVWTADDVDASNSRLFAVMRR